MSDLDRVKSNVQTMLDKGASEHEVDSYLGSEGVTPEQLRAAPTAAGPDKSYTGGILPFSVDAQGNKHFDPHAGILGWLTRGAETTGNVMQGKTDPRDLAGTGQALEMALGATPAGPGFRASGGAIPGIAEGTLEKAVIPSTKELKTLGGEQIGAAKQMDTAIAPDAVHSWFADTVRGLRSQGYTPNNAPTLFKDMGEFYDGLVASHKAGEPIPLRTLIEARDTWKNSARDFNNPTQSSAGTNTLRSLDQFLSSAGQGESATGNPAGVPTYVAGRENYAAGKRSQLLEALGERAAIGADAANSGNNLGNSVRSQVASVLKPTVEGGTSRAWRQGFDPQEIDALRSEVVQGTPAANLTRSMGKRLGGGGGLGQSMLAGGIGTATGLATGNPYIGAAAGAVPIMAGSALRGVSDALTTNALKRVGEGVRTRSALYRERLDARGPGGTAPRTAVAKALLYGASGGPNAAMDLTKDY